MSASIQEEVKEFLTRIPPDPWEDGGVFNDGRNRESVTIKGFVGGTSKWVMAFLLAAPRLVRGLLQEIEERDARITRMTAELAEARRTAQPDPDNWPWS